MSPERLEAFRRRFPVVVEIPVAWGEMDAFQHVNNAAYFRYFESARIACFERIGYASSDGLDGVGPILAATDCRFRIPLTYPDRLLSGTFVEAIAADRFTMRHAIYSHRQADIAAEGSGRIVSYDYRAGTKAQLPDAIRAQLELLREGA
jgi:acyl-CoA thioester hydrolase